MAHCTLAQQMYIAIRTVQCKHILGQQVKGYNRRAGNDKCSVSYSSAPEDGLQGEGKSEEKGYAKLGPHTNLPGEYKLHTAITREKLFSSGTV